MSSKPPERWLPIAGYEGLYEVSDHGRVRSLDREIVQMSRGGRMFTRTFSGRILEFGIRNDRRRQVTLRKDGKNTNFKVHRLVLSAFAGVCPDGMESRHVNGLNEGDGIANLAWGTKAQNQADSHRLGEIQRGSAHHQARLDEQTIALIRNVMVRFFTYQKIADTLGISRHHVADIVNRRRWAHVA